MKSLKTVLLVSAAVNGLTALAAPVTIDFDHRPDNSVISAPGVFADVVPGPNEGPSLTVYDSIGAHFDGGVILSGDFFDNNSNVYATSDFLPLNDGSLLPGQVLVTFSTPVTSFSLIIINGFAQAHFTITADTGESSSIPLDGFLTPGDKGSTSISGPGMHTVLITSDQAVAAKDFAIDDVTFQAVPEPLTVAGMLTGMAFLRRRLSNAA